MSTLEELMAEAKDLLGELRRTLPRARRLGEVLTLIKKDKGHGNWQRWLREHLDLSEETARRYMRLHEYRELTERLWRENPDITTDTVIKAISGAKKFKDRKRPSAKRWFLSRSRRNWNKEEKSDEEKIKSQHYIKVIYNFLRNNAVQLPPVGCIESHFLDSGSYSLQKEALKHGTKHNCDPIAYYSTPDFHVYRDQYAEFVQKYAAAIDLYANIDVIGNPELTWRNQLYLEHVHGITPVPVVHYGSDDEHIWLNRYIDKGHKLIALGGLVGSTSKPACLDWIQRCFEVAEKCATTERQIKLHGFGVASHAVMSAVPWHSVDSSAWLQVAKHGNIYVPRRKDGEVRLDLPPRIIRISDGSAPGDVLDSPLSEEVRESDDEKYAKHYAQLKPQQQQHVREWLKKIGVRLGRLSDSGKVARRGVTNHYEPRRWANLKYFQRYMEQSNISRFYYSGGGSRVTIPERMLGDEANVMLTFFSLVHDQTKGKLPARFRRIYQARRRTTSTTQ